MISDILCVYQVFRGELNCWTLYSFQILMKQRVCFDTVNSTDGYLVKWWRRSAIIHVSVYVSIFFCQLNEWRNSDSNDGSSWWNFFFPVFNSSSASASSSCGAPHGLTDQCCIYLLIAGRWKAGSCVRWFQHHDLVWRRNKKTMFQVFFHQEQANNVDT